MTEDWLIPIDPEVPDSHFDEDLMLEALLSFARRIMEFLGPKEKFTIRTEFCCDTIGIYLEECTTRIAPAVLENLFNPFSDRHSSAPGLKEKTNG